jgi:molybdopterin converting factor small subunit
MATPMQVNVRLSGELATLVGRPRLAVVLASGATVGDLVNLLREQYPQATLRLENAVPIVAGQHVSRTEALESGQEVAFLLPIAGGRF